ncbi:MAG TPA: thioredoxin [Streptosporangiaceae bacterium]|jgi:thioredoxin 1
MTETAAVGAAAPVTVTDADFEARVLRAEGPVLVEFWATWCPPCRQLAPVLDELAAEYAGRLTVAKVDMDVSPRTALAYGVMAAPTMLLFRDGAVVHQAVGAMPKRRIARDLEGHL